jgi:hypothetical protein
MNTQEHLCVQLNKLLNLLPSFKEPSSVPFNNGLYFFYEKGEISRHAPDGRIVRIGNHPRSQDTLKRRLRMHYSGGKNGSVFRKFLGGAIIRRMDPSSPCLQPHPGKGHWEKQDMHPCENCRSIENQVTQILKTNFWFRCIEIREQELRNTFEKKLIATVSLCPVCKPSEGWLGKFAYSDNVQESGLWNSDHVFEKQEILNDVELAKLEQIISHTSNYSQAI